MTFDPAEHPHRRYNPLLGEWVLVSPHRAKRPWHGQTEPAAAPTLPQHDPECYLCPRNIRAEGHTNPNYTSTYVFHNDFPALLEGVPHQQPARSPLFQSVPVSGECRVICYSPRHDLTMANMIPEQIHQVVNLWADQEEELHAKWDWVQIFENKGAMMGCSAPHPHGQIWATSQLPSIPAKELQMQREWSHYHGGPLLLEIAQEEVRLEERTVSKNEHWVAVVPFWATWPFELLILPLEHTAYLRDLTPDQRADLATLLKETLSKLDRLFDAPFPYSFGWHSAPASLEEPEVWQLHGHLYPPLLRSASVRKFMVGYEMLGEPQRDLTPEQAAAQLRGLS